MLRPLLYFAATLVLTSCGGSNNNNNTTTELEGTWATSCSASAQNILSLTFSGNSYTYVGKIFADSSCQTLNGTLTASGTFTIGDALSSPSGAKNIDYLQTSQTILPVNGYAAQVNAWGCGITFQDGVTTNLAGVNCTSLSIPELANGATWFDIYRISGTTLQHGADESPYARSTTGVGSSDANRPTALAASFTKQ